MYTGIRGYLLGFAIVIILVFSVAVWLKADEIARRIGPLTQRTTYATQFSYADEKHDVITMREPRDADDLATAIRHLEEVANLKALLRKGR